MESGELKELVVISGKGGTGKTSITASFASLAKDVVIADCDVDAADLHLLLNPTVLVKNDFYSGHEAKIDEEKCTGCGICYNMCRFDAIKGKNNLSGINVFSVNQYTCEGCGVCFRFCPNNAIKFVERYSGEWMISETNYGKMVHAKLGVAAENSGKLVAVVRKEAKQIAEKEDKNIIIIDGPPGIGCPVIGSITGVSEVLVVTEPTVSGEHDLLRVLSLLNHFKMSASVCVNKWDLNKKITKRIEEKAIQSGVKIAGRIRYDNGVTLAQTEKKPVVETNTNCVDDIINIWNNLEL